MLGTQALMWHGASLLATHGLSCPVTRGILVPWLGIEPTCPALKSMFLTTGPPQVPKSSFLKIPAILYLVFPTMSIENCSLLVYRAASESSREGCFLVSSSFWGRQHSLGCDWITPVFVSVFTGPSPLNPSQIPFCPSLLKKNFFFLNLVAENRGSSLVVGHGLLIEVASLAVEHKLGHTGSVLAAPRR